jgi:hypothetical protein
MISLERGDVYIAPEEKLMDSAVQCEAVDPATMATVVYMIPVLAVQKGMASHEGKGVFAKHGYIARVPVAKRFWPSAK